MKRTGVLVLLMALLIAPPAGTWGQTTAKHGGAGASSASSFAPLEKWKAAVIAGDVQGLAAMYSTDPPATANLPTGQTADPTVEPNFWGGLAQQGLANFKPKVMEIRKPQPGIVILLLRTEFTIGKSVPTDAVIGGAQVWQQQPGGVWRIVQSQRTQPSQAPQRRLPEPEKFNTDLYAPPDQASAEIAEALVKAGREHKRVILMFGGNWCIDCHVLNAALHSKANEAILSANYVLVHVNIGEESKDNLDIASKYDTPLDKGVPALCVLDPDGKVVYSQKQGEFESTVRIGPEDVTAFLKKWKPTRG
jgi:ketosteroid isomerase-like protein